MEDRKQLRRRLPPFVEVPIEYANEDGAKTRLVFRLSFDFNALRRFEEKTGLNALSLEIWTQLSANVLGAMLWAAMLAHQPDYDDEAGFEVVCSYLDLSNADAVSDALWDAYLLFLPAERAKQLRETKERLKRGEEAGAEGKAPAQRAPASSPGSPSGPLAATTSA